MPFDYHAVIAQSLIKPVFTEPPPGLEKLRPRVVPAEVQEGQLYWKAICAYNFPEKNNVYLAAVGRDGMVIHQPPKIFGWTWEGRNIERERADPIRGDKPTNEPPG
ncbi:hypothetical protein C4588_04000, partial [Candidatus Parcubacteria bacterium]